MDSVKLFSCMVESFKFGVDWTCLLVNIFLSPTSTFEWVATNSCSTGCTNFLKEGFAEKISLIAMNAEPNHPIVVGSLDDDLEQSESVASIMPGLLDLMKLVHSSLANPKALEILVGSGLAEQLSSHLQLFNKGDGLRNGELVSNKSCRST